MLVGFVLTLFNKNSRYWNLIRKIGQIQTIRKDEIQPNIKWKQIGVIVISLMLAYIGFTYLQNDTQKSARIEHTEKFGRLLVQTYNGRFAPINTLAYDVMHKISKKDEFKIEGKGKMGAMQVFSDILEDEEFWKQQKIIYVRQKSVGDIIGVEGSYASFNDFFVQGDTYKMMELTENALRKNPEERNTFDNEILKVSERVEVFFMTLQGRMLNLFPDQNSSNNKWLNWAEESAYTPLKGYLQIINEDLQLEKLNYNSIMTLYLKEVSEASISGDYSRADKILGYIESIQRQSPAATLLPSEAMVDAEIFYNEAKIFITLKNIFGILSIILLLFAFIDNLKTKKNKFVSTILNSFIVLFGVAFACHTFGMILRWYVSGHSPWSDGYEVLLLAAWSVMLAGFSFLRYSKIALAGTAFLAFLILMTAAHSSFDPQLTNLTPVLKSEWLIIHVATLTIGYGFLGLGFILGLMYFILSLSKTKKNQKRLDTIIDELTCINELTLTIGLFWVTIGVFFGAVWANETWGSYWKWDAKETWSLATIIAYSIVLHFRLVPFMNGKYIFNLGAVISFTTVIVTFFGVNYYFTKSIHSYASANMSTLPLWGWIVIFLIATLFVFSGIKEKKLSFTNPPS
jgi:cytochrome c-type biogenesis protein CcsB